jgi:hypothetical protein
MLTFYGTEIELFVERELVRDDGLSLCCARDWTAHRWLIIRVDEDLDHLAWMCVPVSERTIVAVASGRASLKDAIEHSVTGTVDLIVVDHGRAVADRHLPCVDIPQGLLPSVDRRVPSAA